MIKYIKLSEEIRKALEEKCETKMSAELLYKEICNCDDNIENIELVQRYNLSLNTIKKIRYESLSADDIENMLGVEYDNAMTGVGLVIDKIDSLLNSGDISDNQRDKIHTYVVSKIKSEL